jgi:hypothetical protein
MLIVLSKAVFIADFEASYNAVSRSLRQIIILMALK